MTKGGQRPALVTQRASHALPVNWRQTHLRHRWQRWFIVFIAVPREMGGTMPPNQWTGGRWTRYLWRDIGLEHGTNGRGSGRLSIVRLVGTVIVILTTSAAVTVIRSTQAGAARNTTSGPAAALATPFGGVFNGVSCTSTGNCTAVGSSFGQPTIANETDGTWGPVTNITAPSGGGRLLGVSCSSPGNCTAVGDDNNLEAEAATEANGSWGPATDVGSPGVIFGSRLLSVSCASAGICTAVGFRDGAPIVAHETAGHWSPEH